MYIFLIDLPKIYLNPKISVNRDLKILYLRCKDILKTKPAKYDGHIVIKCDYLLLGSLAIVKLQFGNSQTVQDLVSRKWKTQIINNSLEIGK